MNADPTPAAGGLSEEIAELRRLYANSTPGKWKLWGMLVAADQDGTSNIDTAVEVAQTFFRDEHGKPRTWDADLICHMQRSLPALLDLAARTEAAERELARVTAAVEALADEWESDDYICGEDYAREARAALSSADTGAPTVPPPCDNHREVQHRDGKPPWCRSCGWRHGKPAQPPVQMIRAAAVSPEGGDA